MLPERRLRDAVITFENGNKIEIRENCAMPIASAGEQEATFSTRGVDLNDMRDIIDEYIAERRREAERQTLSAEIRDAIDSLSDAAKLFASAYGVSFMESLNSVWTAMGDDFELADEEEYVATDPISFDELMGGCCGDN